MGLYHKRPTVADIRALKGKRTLTMLYVDAPDEAAAASEAGIDMLSIIDPAWTPEMREAAGNCFVQVGLLYGALVTLEDYQRAAHRAMQVGGDCVYCASSFGTIKALADDGIPVVSHVGLIPSKATWTGGFKAVGKTANSAMEVFRHVKALEEIGCFGVELEVVPDRVAAEIAKRTNLVLLGMGAGPYADAQYLFAEDVLGYTPGHNRATPRHTGISAASWTGFSRNGSRHSGNSVQMSRTVPTRRPSTPSRFQMRNSRISPLNWILTRMHDFGAMRHQAPRP